MSSTELYFGPTASQHSDSNTTYHVRLPVFDGPLDLLLHLIRTHELDIYDIPIAEITKQYLEILELMEELNLSLAGEFLVMAATLIHIKSKMLLPPPHEDGTEDEPSEDPRAELVARLLEYERYKEAAQQLHQQETLRSATWVRPEEAIAELAAAHVNGNGSGGVAEGIEVDLFELLTAFREVLTRIRQRQDLTIEREAISIEEMIQRLDSKLTEGEERRFVDLFDEARDRATVVVTFLAILEMVRMKILRIFQRELFGTIYLRRLTDA